MLYYFQVLLEGEFLMKEPIYNPLDDETAKALFREFMDQNPIDDEDIRVASEEAYQEGLISEEEYQEIIDSLQTYEEKLERAQLNKLSNLEYDEEIINDFLRSFKKANFLEKHNMSIDELAKYYCELRKYKYFRGDKLHGIQIRKNLHFLVSTILAADQLFSREKLLNVNDLREQKELILKIQLLFEEIKKSLTKNSGNKPKIFVCTHIGGNDVQRAFQIIKDPAWLMFGNPGVVYKKAIYQGLKLNGVLPLETFDKVDRKITYNRALELLFDGGNLLIFPEGAWNVSPHELIMKLFVGAVRLAQESGAEIIPLALEQYGKTFYYHLGEGYTIPQNSDKSLYELRDELREKLATLKWDILLTQEPLKRDEIPEDYLQQFQDDIIGRCNYGYGFSLQDALREKFHDKTIINEEEVFSFLENLEINTYNAFLAKDKLKLVLKK